MQTLIATLHALAGMLWVGGIFFAYMALRPAANTALEPAPRLGLWAAVFGRFFPWVWGFIAVLLASGYADLFGRFGGLGTPLLYLKGMHGIGWLMTILFAYLYFAPFQALKRATAAGDTPAAAAAMARMRPVIATNLVLGILITALGVAGPAIG